MAVGDCAKRNLVCSLIDKPEQLFLSGGLFPVCFISGLQM